MALTPLHLRAIHLLLLGHSNAHVARKLGISRTTLYRWHTFHARFVAELARQRREAFTATHQRLRTLLQRSLSVLASGLTAENWDTRFRAARAILTHCGPRSAAPDPADPYHPDEMVNEIAQGLRDSLPGDPLKGVPLTDIDRQQALAFLSQNLAAPALPFDPQDPDPSSRVTS